jgi:hypothetical protein
MAYLLATYDLPPSNRMFTYGDEALVVLRHFAETEGYVRVVGMRAPDNTSPNVVVAFEYRTLADAWRVAESEMLAEQLQILRDLGCTGINLRVMDASPLIPRS